MSCLRNVADRCVIFVLSKINLRVYWIMQQLLFKDINRMEEILVWMYLSYTGCYGQSFEDL